MNKSASKSLNNTFDTDDDSKRKYSELLTDEESSADELEIVGESLLHKIDRLAKDSETEDKDYTVSTPIPL